MSDTRLPIIEQFSLKNGRWENDPTSQSAVRQPPQSKKGHLLVQVTLRAPAEQTARLEGRLVALLRDQYYLARGGVTASLRHSVNAANQWLYEHNQKQPSDHQILGGAALVVLQDDDIFLAQVGPCVAYGRLNGFLKRYPEQSPWFDGGAQASSQSSSQPSPPSSMAKRPALGSYRLADPNLFHLHAEPGDTIILMDESLAQTLKPLHISQTLAQQKPGSVGERLGKLAKLSQGAGIVVQISQPQTSQPQVPVSEASPSSPSSPPLKKVTVTATSSAPLQALREKVPATLSDLVEAGRNFNLTMPEMFSGTPQDAQKRRPKQETDSPSTPRQSAPPASSAQGKTQPGEPEQDSPWQKIVVAVLGVLALLGSGLQTVLKLVLPGNQADFDAPVIPQRQAGGRAHQAQPTATTPQRHVPPKVLLGIAIGLPILVVLITVFVYWQRGYQEEQAYQTAFTAAQQSYQQAISLVPSDRTLARQRLLETEQFLAEAIAIRGLQPEIETLQTEIALKRDEIDRVQRLFYVPTLTRYPELGTQVQDVIVQGVDIYVLDTGQNQVYQHILDDTGDTLLPSAGEGVLLSAGQSLENVTVGRLIDFVWMPTGGGRQTSDLLILSENGLFTYNPSWGVTPIPLNANLSQLNPVSIGSYFGNFYLLDTASNQIYRYLPSVDGYETPAEPYFSDASVNLQGAVDMAIDGAIYVLYQNGSIQKFLGGQPTEFQLQGLEIPLNNPTAIYTAPDELVQYLYVADAGNERIVQFTKDGEFVRHFKPRLDGEARFDNLRSIFVDEIGEKMFVLNGDSLYAPNIPNIQSSPTAPAGLETSPEEPPAVLSP